MWNSVSSSEAATFTHGSRGDVSSDLIVLLTPLIFSFSLNCLPSQFVLSHLFLLATAFLFFSLAGRELNAIWGHGMAGS